MAPDPPDNQPSTCDSAPQRYAAATPCQERAQNSAEIMAPQRAHPPCSAPISTHDVLDVLDVLASHLSLWRHAHDLCILLAECIMGGAIHANKASVPALPASLAK